MRRFECVPCARRGLRRILVEQSDGSLKPESTLGHGGCWSGNRIAIDEVDLMLRLGELNEIHTRFASVIVLPGESKVKH